MVHNSAWRIIAKNTFTLFNAVNLVLALMVAFVGSYKNMLFILIAVANTLISIIDELRAKRITDKLKLLTEQKPVVIRDGHPQEVEPSSVVKGDVVALTLGNQVLYDSVIQSGAIEVNESFITGEQDNILKIAGDHLISGSFVVSGSAEARVENIGAGNFVTKLQNEAHTIKTADSKLFKLMNNIVKYISYTLIPIGALLLWARFRTEPDTTSAVTSTVAALINMIPEGLILLTSSVLALATIRLSRRKVLVQDLYAIETLARVDTICLDKTGTLTTGNMTVKDFIPVDGEPLSPKSLKTTTTKSTESLLNALEAILSHTAADNDTSRALKKSLGLSAKSKPAQDGIEAIPFSSERKYSGVKIGDTEYLLGATGFLTTDPAIIKQAKRYKGIYRLLAVVKNDMTRAGDSRRGTPKMFASQNFGGGEAGRTRPENAELLGFVRLEDEIRPTAPKIIQYFYDNNINVKIISGDDNETVTAIATTVGVKSPKGVDLSTIKRPNYAKLIREYNIFTRVKPDQKKDLIVALRKQGNTVAMTGDGVNDILAMKEADCSIAIGAGSDAARRSAKFVLLDSGYDAVPSIIAEGRQSINNLERSTTLFLAKTVYASILAVLFVVLPLSYPFSPIEMSLLNFLCIGFPGLVLALEKNTARVKNRFISNIREYSVPIGLTVSVACVALSVAAHVQGFSRPELTTTSVLTTFFIDVILIYWISRPLNILRGGLLAIIIALMLAAFLVPFAREFFEFTFLPLPALVTTIVITATSIVLFTLIRFAVRHFLRRTSKTQKIPRR